MDCRDIKKLFFDYIDGRLTPEEEKAVKAHLASCKGCSGRLYEYKKSWEILGSISPIKPSPDYVSRFWKEASLRVPWHERVSGCIRDMFLYRRLAYRFVFAAVIIIALNVSVYNYVNTIRTRTLLINMNEEELEMIEDYDMIADLDAFEEDVINNGT